MQTDFDPDDERVFIAGFVAGDPARMMELSQRLTCVRRMLRVRNRAMGFPLSPAELDDVEQDAVMTILRRLPSFRPLAPLEAWIHGICCLHVRDAVRAKKRRSSRVGTLDEDVMDNSRSDENAVDDWSEVEAVLQRLGGVESEVVRLKHFEDLTFEAVARQMGLPVNTVKSHYYRGLTRLRAVLTNRGQRP